MNPIVGIGELLWDVFPDGHKVAGGAPFNFAFHCRQLGHDAVVVSRVGDDDLGRELRAEVRRLGLTDEFIQTDPDHPTGTVRVAVDAAGVPSYQIVEDVAWDHLSWTDELQHLTTRAVAVTFGTLGSRSHSSDAILAFISAVRRFNTATPRVFDVNLRQSFYTRPLLLGLLGVSNWMKVNEEETALLDGMGFHPFDHYFDMLYLGARNAPQYHRLDRVCETRGGHGCEVVRRWEVNEPEEGGSCIVDELVTEPGVPARIVDTVGAGDSFTAAMVCLYLEGRPLRDCARFATHYAARVCEHRGATPRIDRAEVERAAFG